MIKNNEIIAPNNHKYLHYGNNLSHKIEGHQLNNTVAHLNNLSKAAKARRLNLELLLAHFTGIDFPRTISTKTTEGRQILANDKEEALARFKQANYLDCRINAYTELDDTPNFLFIDIDSLDFSIIVQLLNKCREFDWVPTVLFTGSGYHIYQPLQSTKLQEIPDLTSYDDLPKQFLKFAAEYFSADKADANHNPSLKSCMVRVPGSINSKNGQKVRVLQEWDGQRP